MATVAGVHLAAEILSRYQRYGWSQPVGEWGSIQAGRSAYKALLDSGDMEAIDQLFQRMFRSALVTGLITLGLADAAALPTDYHPMVRQLFEEVMLHNLTQWRQGTGEPIAILTAPAVGAPLTVEVAQVPIMMDTPRHDHYAQRMLQLLPTGGTVLEIGGGYGGWVRQAHQRRQDFQVVLCDLPETLYVAWYWLTHVLPAATVDWVDVNPAADVVLLPARQLGDWSRADIWFSAHSLGEMDQATVDRYVAWAHTRRPRYLYHDNADRRPDRWNDPGLDQTANSALVFPETLAADFGIDRAQYRLVSRTPVLWSGSGSRYAEYLYEAR